MALTVIKIPASEVKVGDERLIPATQNTWERVTAVIRREEGTVEITTTTISAYMNPKRKIQVRREMAS